MRLAGPPGKRIAPPAGVLPSQTGAVPVQNQPDVSKYITCMRKNGLPKFPEPNAQGMFTGIDTTTPAFKAAQKACAKTMPSGAPAPPS